MTVETILRKRPALFPKEVGLFPDNPMAAEDFQIISSGSDVFAKLSTPRNLQMLKYLWALATKVAESRDDILDKEDAMSILKRKAKFVKFALNPKTDEMELREKSLARLNNEAMQRLANRMVFITCSDIIPGIEEAALRDELLKMVT